MATNVSEVIDEARFNAYHLRIVALCGLLILFDGFDLFSISFAAPQFVKFLGIDRPLIAPVFSAGLFGLTLGALLLGLVADRIGAKRVFILCGVMFGLFSIATALATSLTTLMICRFLAGLALGGASPIAIAIASDFCPKRVRVSVVMLMYISLAVGQILAGLCYQYVDLAGWRTVFYVGGILPILLAPLLLSLLPETLEHLVAKGEAPSRINAILRRVDPRRAFAETSFVMARENRQGFQPLQLFQDGRAAVTAVLWVVFFASLIAIYFFNNWIPTLLTGGGLSGAEVTMITNALPFGGVIGTLIAAPVVMKLGGFQTVTLGYLAAALAMVVLGTGGTGFAFLAAATFAVGAFLIGTQSVLNASCAGVYPPIMRSTGVGWGFGIGRVGAILSPGIAGWLVALKWTPSELFVIAAVPTLVACAGAFCVWRIQQGPPELGASRQTA
jgi:AAHS family 4-hydroxybenzoate transporter-like MFS transporter